MLTFFSRNIAPLSLLFFCLTIQAQESVVPLDIDPARYQVKAEGQNLKTTATAATTDTITLPFIDDFSSTYTSYADTSLWLEGGDTYINNRLCVDPPTRNVATFDGLKADGTPYIFTTQETNISGLADQLTSKPIDLSGLFPDDSLVLSFYWQKGGRTIHNFPDIEDSLFLEFRDSTGQWVYQYGIDGDVISGNTSIEDFTYAYLPITDSIFFHAGFQFRFNINCTLNGNYDIFHIDYIHLDTARKVTDIIADVAYSSPLSSYLAPYTSITRKQFFADPEFYVADSVYSYVTNPSGSNFINANINQEAGYLVDTISGTSIETMNTGINALMFPGDKNIAKWNPTASNLSGAIPPLSTDSPVVLKYKFDMVTQDSLLTNDSIIGYNIIDNYMAYDDGTAEASYVYPGTNNKFALKFELKEQDTLYYIQTYFPKRKKDNERRSIQWRIWKTLEGIDGLNDQLYYAKTALLIYSDELNGFSIDSMTKKTDFPNSTDNGVIIPAGTFYIGFVQFSDDELQIGLDYNTNTSTNFYANGGFGWNNSFGQSNECSIMMRPVFGKRKPFDLTPITQYDKPLSFTIFPNPGNASIKSTKDLTHLTIHDITGNTIKTIDDVKAFDKIDVSNLPSGIYLLEGVVGKQRAVRRFVKY